MAGTHLNNSTLDPIIPYFSHVPFMYIMGGGAVSDLYDHRHASKASITEQENQCFSLNSSSKV